MTLEQKALAAIKDGRMNDFVDLFVADRQDDLDQPRNDSRLLPYTLVERNGYKLQASTQFINVLTAVLCNGVGFEGKTAVLSGTVKKNVLTTLRDVLSQPVPTDFVVSQEDRQPQIKGVLVYIINTKKMANPESLHQIITEGLGALFSLCRIGLSDQQCFERTKWCIKNLKMPTPQIVDAMRQVELLSAEEQGSIAHCLTCIIAGGSTQGDPGMDIKVVMKPETGFSFVHTLVSKLAMPCPMPMFLVKQDYILAEFVLSWEGWDSMREEYVEGKFQEVVADFAKIGACEMDDPTMDIYTSFAAVLRVIGDAIGDESMRNTHSEQSVQNDQQAEPQNEQPLSDSEALPDGWSITLDPDTGAQYYQNIERGLSAWDISDIRENSGEVAVGRVDEHDLDEELPEVYIDDGEDAPEDLPPGWEAVETDDGQTYYQNLDTEDSVWHVEEIPGYGYDPEDL